MTVGIVGCGLIGGSIGLALRSEGHRLLGFDSNKDSLRVALERGCLDAAGTMDEVCSGEVVFICVPPAVVVAEAAAALAAKSPETVVTDCTSVKGSIVEWLGATKEPKFVPGHPMAGHEKSGPKFASGWMFKGARWILTPCKFTDKAAIKVVERLVVSMGATPIRVDAERHDREVALLSHLPHVLAGALVQMAADLESTEASGGSWRDLTRVGGVDPDLWSQILASNRTEVVKVLEEFESRVSGLRRALSLSDSERVRRFFVDAKESKKGQA